MSLYRALKITHFLALFFLNGYCFQGQLEDRFHHYETLHISDINVHREKRSVNGPLIEKRLSFTTLGKYFTLNLRAERGLFSKGFEAISLDHNGHINKIDLKDSFFYTGYVEDESWSRVHVYWQGQDLSAVIKTTHDVYVIEPSRGLLPKSEKFSMISYKMSDMKEKVKKDLGRTFCGFVEANGTDKASADHPFIIAEDTLQQDVSMRKKRQSSSKTVCQVALVADYHYFQDVAQSSETNAISSMVSTLTYANDIFQSTDFGSGMGTGYSMQIKRVIVHKVATPVNDGQIHYNMQVNSGANWDVNELLRSFSRNDWTDVCLAQLYTSQDFNAGILGLGWIASAQSGTTGGICSPRGNTNYNTAFSSSKNSGGNRLTTLEANLVATHELGHNWGSPHDPESCAPSGQSGGKYIMYQNAVDGYDDNNDVFSSCSRNTMGAVLAAKKDRCFVERDAAICGNQILEAGESCDEGFDGGNCCTSSCVLYGEYTCSDVNHPCCDQCQFADANTQCAFFGTLSISCKNDSYCDGTSSSCPAAPNKVNGASCSATGGQCSNGVCLSVCELNGLIDCNCEQVELSCKVCCAVEAGGTCEAYHSGNNVLTDYPDGQPCVFGICSNGVCEKQISSLDQRTWDLIRSLSTSSILEFMRSNIVLTVIVLTLIIYVPFVIITIIIDWRNDEEDEKERDWLHRDNDALILENSSTMIRPTYTRHRAGRGRDGGDSVVSGRISESGVSVGVL